ncbi:disintegrin and metalloproteinase domain-containing protein 32-like isoform X3 [Lathamus discolor]|uniref:disintegrin and metalloproteinase domain-containing protein 32-like isoform X3 n=1 Tax=Lathamus discolor TaxID=678569 RepID=UPI0032B8405F
MVWVGKDPKIIQFQPPCHRQGHLTLNHPTQGFIQPGLEHCQGWSTHNLPGQPIPVPQHPHRKEFPPWIQSKLALFQFESITPCPIPTVPSEESIPSIPIAPSSLELSCSPPVFAAALSAFPQPTLPFSALLPTKDAVSYVLKIEGRPYTLRLQPQFFLSDDFRIYTYNEKGSLRSASPPIKGSCYYRGYIDGFPSSAVTLSTCSGLRGLLQLDNVSYGIEPLGYSPAFEHLVYRVRDGKAAGSLLASSHPEAGPDGLTAMEAPSRAQGRDEPRYERKIALHLLLERALYDYLGADDYVVVQKMVQVCSLLSIMFRPLNLTVTLSSVEVWMDNSMLKTTGNAEEVLMRLLQWKKSSHILQPLEVPYLLLYRDQAAFVGTTAPGKVCQRDAAGIVAVFQKGVTLESFSALLAQLLGRSLGMGYDESPQCRCPGRVCIMSPEALSFNGAKAFSSCSIRDFQTFLKQNRDCPVMRQAQPQPSHHQDSCGNGIVEAGEQCDCGSMEDCALDKCCTPQCLLKPGVQCSSGLCCQNCQFKRKQWQCRPAADEQCDLAEFCTGASASCPPDLYVQDGHGCEQGTGYCYKGRCQSPDLQCQQIYGKGAKNAPLACYEEVNSQQDRFGHCGNHPMDGYQPCSWPNLGCGKLVCVYPNRLPFTKMKGAIIYAHVQEHLCVSFDFMNGPTKFDPLMVKEGTKCGPGKVCLNGSCQPHSVLNYDCNVQEKCHGHGELPLPAGLEPARLRDHRTLCRRQH